MTRPLVIFGTGPFAEVARKLFELDGGRTVVAFTVHRDHLDTDKVEGLPVVPFEDVSTTHPPQGHDMFVAVGYKDVNQLRARIVGQAKAAGYRLATYVSPRATTFPDLEVGENTFIFEDNTLQPYVRIGDNVVIWSGCHIGHHSVVEDHCFITSHVVVSGNVRVGAGSFLGVNCTLRDSITIGRANVIGAGALIMRSTEDNEAYIPQRTKPSERKSTELGL